MQTPRDNLVWRVRQALAVYLERGRAALAVLGPEPGALGPGAEEFFKLMSLRDAAFHNFRALDALAAADGVDIALDPHIKALWREIDCVNRTLAGRMQDAQAAMGARLAKLKTFSRRSQAYRSGTPPALKLVKQV